MTYEAKAKRLGDFGYRERIEMLEERVLKLENPLHMPLVKLHERIDKLEEQVAGLRRATEGHFGMVHERIAKLEDRIEALEKGLNERIAEHWRALEKYGHVT